MRTVAAVVALVACVHAGLWALMRDNARAPNFEGQLASVSYAPFEGSAHPNSGALARTAQIRADLKMLAPLTRAIRTYSSTGGVELVPGIASEFGLRVTAGAWIDKNQDRNEREIRSVVDLAKRHSNINGIIVANETIFRGEQKVGDLIQMIQRVKRSTNVPVTTGEIWHVWIEHPELVSAVDYIAAHILPYWEGFSDAQAVDQAILIYDKLRQAYPGKRIVIAEFGWPSAGYNLKNANPGRIEQAVALRDFVSRADAHGIDYNIVEAIDQPWKIFEGGVGPYWGIFDAARHPKFDWTGPIIDPDHWRLAAIAILVSVLLSLPLLAMSAVTLWQAAMLVGAANIVGAWFAAVFGYWNGHYFVPGAAFALGLGMLLLIPLIVIALARIEEIAAVAFGRKPLRLIASPPLAPDAVTPKVSIHIPAHNEPPEMLVQTLDAVARLDYQNYECIVVINNTPDPGLWLPVEEHCRALGERFKFVRADNIAGFKAGALRLALVHTAADADVIGIIDADYVVQKDWLKDLVPLFADFQRRPGAGAAGSSRWRTQCHALCHERRIRRLLRHRHGAAERGQCDHCPRHNVPGAARSDRSRRRMVERHDLRRHRSRPHAARARLADPLHQQALRARPTARQLRGLQEAEAPLGLWRLPDSQEALASIPAGREPAHTRAEARIHTRLAQLAGRGKHRRRGCHLQYRLGTGGRLPRYCCSRPYPDGADHRELHCIGRALRDALSAARASSYGTAARLSLRGDVGAVDGRASGRLRRDQGSLAVRSYVQGWIEAFNRLPRLLGGDAGGLADCWGSRTGCDQRQGNPRDQHFRCRAPRTELALHCGRRPRRDRTDAAQ